MRVMSKTTAWIAGMVLLILGLLIASKLATTFRGQMIGLGIAGVGMVLTLLAKWGGRVG